MTDLDTLIAAHPDAATSVRTHDGHVVSHTVIVDTDTGRQAHTFDADGHSVGDPTALGPAARRSNVAALTTTLDSLDPAHADDLGALISDPGLIPILRALLAQVTPDQLARVLALGVAVTEPDSVARLTTAVETGDLIDGMAVVAEAAVTAQVSVEGV